MYPGHFAAGLALKAAEPRASTLGLMIGVSLLDLVYGVLVMVGVEGGTLRHIDCTWSHSLASSLVLSTAFAAAFWKQGRRVALVMGGAVFSHYLLDLLSHNPDLSLWPRSRIELGFGPLFGGLGGWLEAAVTLAGCGAYLWAARGRQDFGARPIVVCAMVATTFAAELAVVHGGR